MQVQVQVRLAARAPWVAATLTDERAESSYGQPVVVVHGETCARGPAEVFLLSGAPPAGAPVDWEARKSLLDRALAAGFRGSHAP
jgi:hypothetical protein